MLFPPLNLKPADPNLTLAPQKVSCYFLWSLSEPIDQTPLASQPVSVCYPWFQIKLTDQKPDSTDSESLLFLIPFPGC